MFDRPVIEAIRRHAIEAWPREACGLVVAGEYVPCANLHAEPDGHGTIGVAELMAARARGLEAVVHSHPKAAEDAHYIDYPSAVDMRSQLADAVPYGIVCTDGETATTPFWFGDQAPMPPLIGRGFRHGVTDCLSLIRDWYWSERRIRIKEFPREWEWWLETGDANPHFYRDCFAAAGFVEIDGAPEPGDVFRVSLRSATPNHAGIYLGGSMGLHHLTSRLPVDPTRLSLREPIGRWSGLIQEHRWLRYRG